MLGDGCVDIPGWRKKESGFLDRNSLRSLETFRHFTGGFSQCGRAPILHGTVDGSEIPNNHCLDGAKT